MRPNVSFPGDSIDDAPVEEVVVVVFFRFPELPLDRFLQGSSDNESAVVEGRKDESMQEEYDVYLLGRFSLKGKLFRPYFAVLRGHGEREEWRRGKESTKRKKMMPGSEKTLREKTTKPFYTRYTRIL